MSGNQNTNNNTFKAMSLQSFLENYTKVFTGDAGSRLATGNVFRFENDPVAASLQNENDINNDKISKLYIGSLLMKKNNEKIDDVQNISLQKILNNCKLDIRSNFTSSKFIQYVLKLI